jgi:hypothetical protein
MRDTAYHYLHFYQTSLMSAWHNLTPHQYGYILTFVAVVGYLSMRGAGRR